MKLSELSKLAKKIASTSSRKEKVHLLASLIRELDPEEAEKAVLILTGKIFKDERKLDVSWSTILRVARTLSKVEKVEGVDLGEVVSSLMRSAKRQTSLFEVEQTVPEVYRQLERMAEISGHGSRRRKEEILRSLLSSLSPEEVWLLTNALVGETRLGLSEGLLLDAIAEAKGLPREFVVRATMLVGEPYSLLKMSRKEIVEVRPVPFRPVRPMLAQTAQDLEEVLRELGKCALEYKLDGVRVQVHSDGERVRIFSRRMLDITEMVPEIAGLGFGRVILEGELIAEREGPLPFQVLMRRFRRSRLAPVSSRRYL